MNGNIFNGQIPQYYPYGYNAQIAPIARLDASAYCMPQAQAPALIKGRPVTSFEEARVAQIDLDGSTFIFPDLGNKRIYTKRINADGTATIQSFVLENDSPTDSVVEYATKNEVQDLKKTLEDMLQSLKNSTQNEKTKKIDF